MALHFRECTLTDLDTLTAISKTTFSEAFEKDNNPADFQAYIHKAFRSEKLAIELKRKDSLFYFVYDDETLAGYFKLNINTTQTDVYDSNALEIERIYVIGEHQGKKIGSWILQKIVAKARTLNKSYIWLGVWERNPKAIRFYQRHGFAKFGEHPYYIGSDRQTDWLLRLQV